MLTATNLFDYFEEVPQDGEQALWAARPPLRPHRSCDLKLMPRSPGWQDDPDAVASLERIEAEPWVASVTRTERSADLRLDDDWIETVGQALLDGDAREDTLTDLGFDRRFAVQFWDANATKALHAGHLRNLALGNAIAAALAQAGAEVERRSLISDVGRAMGEAMAGVVNSGQHVHMWPSGDEKSDHFVGDCYAGYVKSGQALLAGAAEQPEDSLTRELTMRDDAADRLIKRVLAGDREALALWSKTRSWAIGGQRKTLARLGIAFDRVFFESDYLSEMVQLTEAGLREGRFKRREDGVIYYPTGHEDFDEFPLVRGDGVPTQHMRSLAYWMAAPDMQEIDSMQVCGIEWVSHITYRRQLMDELMALEPERYEDGMHPRQDIMHGMVARQKRAMSSSHEGALLIDQLIEALDAQLEADPVGQRVRRMHPHPERVAPQAALGFFLTKPVTPDVDFDPENLLVERGSPGWDLARARAHAAAGTACDLSPAEQPDFRFAVVQSEIYRRHLRLAVQRLDVGPLARHIDHLARWQLERERSEHVSRAVATLLDRGARGLGLERQR